MGRDTQERSLQQQGGTQAGSGLASYPVHLALPSSLHSDFGSPTSLLSRTLQKACVCSFPPPQWIHQHIQYTQTLTAQVNSVKILTPQGNQPTQNILPAHRKQASSYVSPVSALPKGSHSWDFPQQLWTHLASPAWNRAAWTPPLASAPTDAPEFIHTVACRGVSPFSLPNVRHCTSVSKPV